MFISRFLTIMVNSKMVLPVLGTFFSLAGLILTILVLIGNLRPTNPLGNIYFLSLDTSNLSTDVVPTLSNIGGTSALRFTRYTIGLWGFCFHPSSPSSSTYPAGCSLASARYAFSLPNLIYRALGVWTNVNSPGTISDSQHSIESLSHATLAMFIVSAAFALFAVLIGGLAIPRSRLPRVVASMFGFLALVMALIAAALATGLFVYLRQAFRDANSSAVAELGSKALGMAWAAGAAQLFAFMFLSISSCYAPERKTSNKNLDFDNRWSHEEEEQQHLQQQYSPQQQQHWNASPAGSTPPTVPLTEKDEQTNGNAYANGRP